MLADTENIINTYITIWIILYHDSEIYAVIYHNKVCFQSFEKFVKKVNYLLFSNFILKGHLPKLSQMRNIHFSTAKYIYQIKTAVVEVQ